MHFDDFFAQVEDEPLTFLPQAHLASVAAEIAAVNPAVTVADLPRLISIGE